METYFIYAWLAVTIFVFIAFYAGSKRALAIFPGIETVNVQYRNRFASGYALHQPLLKRGRANNVLDIVVTDKELWIKSMFLFAGLQKHFGLLHKIKIEDIRSLQVDGHKITIGFINGEMESKEVVLIIKDSDAFLKAIKKHG